MPSAIDNGAETINFFETGYIIIGKKRFDVEIGRASCRERV